jgi:hypothetical protein
VGFNSGVYHTGLLVFRTLSTFRYCEEYKVSETGSVLALRCAEGEAATPMCALGLNYEIFLANPLFRAG